MGRFLVGSCPDISFLRCTLYDEYAPSEATRQALQVLFEVWTCLLKHVHRSEEAAAHSGDETWFL